MMFVLVFAFLLYLLVQFAINYAFWRSIRKDNPCWSLRTVYYSM